MVKSGDRWTLTESLVKQIWMFFDNQKFWSTWVLVHFLCSIDPAKLAKFSGNEIMCRNWFSIHLFCLIHSFFLLIHFRYESKLQSSGDKWIKKVPSHWLASEKLSDIKWMKNQTGGSKSAAQSVSMNQYDPPCKFIFLKKRFSAIFVCYRSWEFKFHRNFKEWTNSKPL